MPGLDFTFIEGNHELVDGRVTVVSTPGHTPGYQGLLVRLPETGSVYLSGCEIQDMYYGIPLRGHGPGIPHSVTWSAAGELVSLKKIRDFMKEEKGQIFCGHDHQQFLTMRHAPEYYE